MCRSYCESFWKDQSCESHSETLSSKFLTLRATPLTLFPTFSTAGQQCWIHLWQDGSYHGRWNFPDHARGSLCCESDFLCPSQLFKRLESSPLTLIFFPIDQAPFRLIRAAAPYFRIKEESKRENRSIGKFSLFSSLTSLSFNLPEPTLPFCISQSTSRQHLELMET